MTEEDDIYSSVPEKVNIGYSDVDKYRLRDFLQEHKGSFFIGGKLARLTGFKEAGTQVAMRKAITDLIEVDGCPIVANAKGFGWITDLNQLSFYADNLEQRRAGLDRRIKAVRGIHERLKNG